MIKAELDSKEWIMELYEPATVEEIQHAEKELQIVLPKVYIELLHVSNGVLGNLAKLYSTDELVEMNKTYEVQSYAPGYVSVGNDNGGYHLLMKAEEGAINFQLVSDGYGVPAETDVTDKFLAWLDSDEGDPWRNE
ncbi:SMI1/KNR4 family protein [Bacillus ndiopicus]|uniref:SMI1/KNR4 family protein n=1 Tax=Bacillus ndiopicus TaxID=1347368 RepID=UPI000694B6C7|nr:SMI1/KNR4 family protein [Bacillus ndiopicus]